MAVGFSVYATLQGGELRDVFTNREVILSAGALQSPSFFSCPVSDPATLLKRYGINVGA